MIYNFIIPKVPGCSLEMLKSGEYPDSSNLRFRGEFIWGHMTYLNLKKQDMPVELAFDLNPEAVNLAHGNVFRALNKSPRSFCVSLQADYPQYMLAQYHVVQNQDQVRANSSYVPHWPLPDQIPRDPRRRIVEKVAYQGARHFTELDEQRFSRDLATQGITFEILDPDQWHDLHDIDVLVGIRHFGKKGFKRKPPTKLIDAWHAGIPFVGGWDSAYSQIGKPGTDYLRVASYDELLSSVIRLKDDRDLYTSLVESGRRKAQAYNTEAITALWKNLLENDIAHAYHEWKEQPIKGMHFQFALLRHAVNDRCKPVLQQLYRIPGVKRFRDRYYDPKV